MLIIPVPKMYIITWYSILVNTTRLDVIYCTLPISEFCLQFERLSRSLETIACTTLYPHGIVVRQMFFNVTILVLVEVLRFWPIGCRWIWMKWNQDYSDFLNLQSNGMGFVKVLRLFFMVLWSYVCALQ